MRGMRKADFYTSIVLMLLGIGVVEESWRMPRFTDLGSSIWSAPGMTPGLIGIVIAILGGILFLRSRRETATETVATESTEPASSSWFAAGLALVMCFAFGIGLIGRIPFMLAAFLFILAFILVFDFRDNRDAYRDRGRALLRAGSALVVAGAAAWAISSIFQDVFFVRLP